MSESSDKSREGGYADESYGQSPSLVSYGYRSLRSEEWGPVPSPPIADGNDVFSLISSSPQLCQEKDDDREKKRNEKLATRENEIAANKKIDRFGFDQPMWERGQHFGAYIQTVVPPVSSKNSGSLPNAEEVSQNAEQAKEYEKKEGRSDETKKQKAALQITAPTTKQVVQPKTPHASEKTKKKEEGGDGGNKDETALPAGVKVVQTKTPHVMVAAVLAKESGDSEETKKDTKEGDDGKEEDPAFSLGEKIVQSETPFTSGAAEQAEEPGEPEETEKKEEGSNESKEEDPALPLGDKIAQPGHGKALKNGGNKELKKKMKEKKESALRARINALQVQIAADEQKMVLLEAQIAADKVKTARLRAQKTAEERLMEVDKICAEAQEKAMRKKIQEWETGKSFAAPFLHRAPHVPFAAPIVPAASQHSVARPDVEDEEPANKRLK